MKQAQEVQNQLIQLERQHKDKVDECPAREQAIKQSYADMGLAASKSLIQIAEGHQNLAATVQKFAQQGLEHVLQALFAEMVGAEDFADGRCECSGSKAGSPLPVCPSLVRRWHPLRLPAFAAVMAFEEGGVVPGVGKGDTVPAMLTPGESMVPGGVMEGRGICLQWRL